MRASRARRFALDAVRGAGAESRIAREAYNTLRARHAGPARFGGTARDEPRHRYGRRSPITAAAAATCRPCHRTAPLRLRSLVRQADVAGWSRDALEKRLDHFIREDARIPEAIDAFRDANAERLGALAAGSQADAETLLGNQIPETSALARTARELGAFASSSFGAGFGGSIWALIEADRAKEFARRWHPDAFIGTPGPPVLELM